MKNSYKQLMQARRSKGALMDDQSMRFDIAIPKTSYLTKTSFHKGKTTNFIRLCLVRFHRCKLGFRLVKLLVLQRWNDGSGGVCSHDQSMQRQKDPSLRFGMTRVPALRVGQKKRIEKGGCAAFLYSLFLPPTQLCCVIPQRSKESAFDGVECTCS